MFKREPVDASPGTLGGGGGANVVGVQDAAVVLVLLGEDALFGQRVVFEGAVAIEVVGRDVEDDGDLRMELLGGFKLEAGDFENVPGGVGRVFNEGDDGNADVAADLRGDSGFLKNFAEERGRGGLAVGTGDGEDLSFEEAGGELELADDGAAEVAGLNQFGRVERNAGADDDEVLAAEGKQAVAAGFDVDALIEKGGNVFGKGFGAANVGDGNLSSLAAQEEGRGEAGFAESDNENFFAFELEHGCRTRIIHWGEPCLKTQDCVRRRTRRWGSQRS